MVVLTREISRCIPPEEGQSKMRSTRAIPASAIFSLLALRLAAHFRLVRTRNIPYSAGKSYSLLGTSFRAHWISFPLLSQTLHFPRPIPTLTAAVAFMSAKVERRPVSFSRGEIATSRDSSNGKCWKTNSKNFFLDTRILYRRNYFVRRISKVGTWICFES